MVAMNNTIFLQDFCDEGHTTTANCFVKLQPLRLKQVKGTGTYVVAGSSQDECSDGNVADAQTVEHAPATDAVAKHELEQHAPAEDAVEHGAVAAEEKPENADAEAHGVVAAEYEEPNADAVEHGAVVAEEPLEDADAEAHGVVAAEEQPENADAEAHGAVAAEFEEIPVDADAVAHGAVVAERFFVEEESESGSVRLVTSPSQETVDYGEYSPTSVVYTGSERDLSSPALSGKFIIDQYICNVMVFL
jgi:hypothetical protein